MSETCVVCGRLKGSVYAGKKCLDCHLHGRGTPEDAFVGPSFADHLTAWKTTQQWTDASEREETFVNGNLNAFAGYLDRTVPVLAPATDADWAEYLRLEADMISAAVRASRVLREADMFNANAIAELDRARDACRAHVARMSGRESR